MDRKKLLKHLVLLMFFIFIADILAKLFYWYSSIWSFDMFMHFLGGFWISLFFIWFFSIKDIFFIPKWVLDFNNYKIILKTILFVLLIGVLWEFFEFYINNYISGEVFNILDTISDLFFDLSGGFFAMLFFIKKIMVKQENNI